MQFKKKMMTAFFLLLTSLMLLHSKESVYYALTGLNLWFLKMVPTLLPFMILSGIMVRMNLTEGFVSLLYPLFRPVFKISKNMTYCILMGFLCGFPMGAKVINELYIRNRISKQEAEYLLAFCNNIGPIYFIGFVLPTLNLSLKMPYLIGMYGIPIVYGLFLRFTVYRKKILCPQRASIQTHAPKENISILLHLDDAIGSAVSSITILGGYMILFNLLNLVPHALLVRFGHIPSSSSLLLAIINGILEITSGISRLGNQFPLITLLLLPFGGFSCIAQTYSTIKESNLSLKKYILHKIILVGLTALYFSLFSFMFSFSLFSLS